MSGGNINKVFYATSYHPIQAGSIDGTDVLPHDNGIRRALLCSSAGLYDPFRDPKANGDPYCVVFVGRLSPLTTEETLREFMSKFGEIKSLRLVRHIVTGASRGYAFVEYETERDMRRAYEGAHHSIIDDHEIIVDFNRQQLMPGWIPRRLGGGLGGKKESGQLRFGGRDRPFRAPLRPIPHEDLKKLGIPPPPEGNYMPRNQVPSPPRRHRRLLDGEKRLRESSVEREDYHDRNDVTDREEGYLKKRSRDERRKSREVSVETNEIVDKKSRSDRKERHQKERVRDKEERHSRKRHKHRRSDHQQRSSSRERYSSG